MNLNLTLRKPLAAAGLLAVILVLAGLGLAAALADLWAAGDERDAKADLVSRSLKGVHAGPQRTEAKDADKLSVEAESETLAAARVDALVRATVLDAGGSILSSRAEVKNEDSKDRIEVQAVVEGRIESLQAALFRLETGTPLVLVDEFSLQQAETSGASTADSQAPSLHATLTLSAYWANPSPPDRRSGPSLSVAR